MPGNSIGKIFTVTTWGESHGESSGAVIDGCPPGMKLSAGDIQKGLDLRKPGSGDSFSSSRKESDTVVILSGVFEGRTTGTPISLIIGNTDAKSGDYEYLRDVYRPGHGDYTYHKKYGIRDHRGGGRASGRETAARVAAGAVAKKILESLGIKVFAYTIEIGGVAAAGFDENAIEETRLRCPDRISAARMEEALEEARIRSDTVGGIVEIVVKGCPAGLGEPVFDKMDADLAKALMSIGTVKGVEIGAGFRAARMNGSSMNDPLGPGGFMTNNAGGILAGITTGESIEIRVACKAIPSIGIEQHTTNTAGQETVIRVGGRHDVSVIPRIIPVCEAMVAIVIADHALRQRACAGCFYA
ncbi:MAG: chorismate synthase [Syntrophales bacterium]|jgi:chorismate synthase|nr:chorismate synthase [Syntrophales bacterium]MDY0043223.1 chorismate synthase [Syntrophales bacterium]